MTAIKLTTFLGEAPIIAAEQLPAGMATSAVNCNLVSGDLDGYYDIGNPYTLAKTAPFNSLYLYSVSLSPYWLQWTNAELAYPATNVDVATGAIPGDTTGHIFITGLGAPCQTNFYYATDPSQRGSSPPAAYPYKTFPIGVANPAAPPVAAQPAAIAGTTTEFEYAQEQSVNNAVTLTVGSGYSQGDVLSIVGGTLVDGLGPAKITINNVTASGAIDTSQPGCISLTTGGFYTNAGPPTSPATVTGGTGSGATFTLTTVSQPGSHNSPPSGWGFAAYDNGSGSYGTFGISSHQWEITSGQGDTYVVYSTQDFSLQTSVSFTAQVDTTVNYPPGSGDNPDILVQFAGTFNGKAPFGRLNGPTVLLSVAGGKFALYNTIGGSNGGGVTGTPVDEASYAFTQLTQYRIYVTATASNNATQTGYSVTAKVVATSDLSTVLATVTGFVDYAGESIAFGTNHRGDHNNYNAGFFENIYITSTQAASQVTMESLNYVTTVENLFAQESGPSDPSQTINVFINGDVTPNIFGPVSVSIPPSSPDAYLLNLYRSVNLGGATEVYELDDTFAAMTIGGTSQDYTVGQTVTGSKSGETGTVFSWHAPTLILNNCSGAFLLDENIVQAAPYSVSGVFEASVLNEVTINYSDTKLDQNLGAALVSANFAPPPSDMQGIVSAANGITAGFSGNLLCLSAPKYPYAYPVLTNQYPTDDPIVAIAVIGTQFVVFTKGYTYTAYGDDPAAFTMQKETSPQACISKRSVATHRTAGVIYASANGLAHYLGPGEIDLLRTPDDEKKLKPIFSIEQWLALNPESIIGIVHDDYYFFWYDNGTTKGGYIVDLSRARSMYAAPGFGIVKMDFHVTCAYVDYMTDTLWLIPDASTLPINGSVVVAALNVVSQWEAAATKRSKTWTRDTILLNKPTGFQIMRVRAQDFTDVNVTIATETGTAFSGNPNTNRAVVIANRMGENLSISITGTSRVYSVELAEAVEELLS